MVIRYTPEARRDLQNIKSYYKELGYPTSAQKHTETIIKSIFHLKENPNMGVSIKAKYGVDTDLRFIVTDKTYLVLYRVLGKTVQITNIVDGRTDVLTWLFIE